MYLTVFTPVGELLWYNNFSVCGSLTQDVWDLILSCPCYHLGVASSLSFDVGYHCIFLSIFVRQLVVILVFP